MVDGKWFENNAAASVNIPSAVGGGNTRIDRIVLRCSWAGYAVSITRIAGTDAASPTAPAIVQTTGTTYDIKLYQALVNTAGAVTLTDERTFGGAMTAGYAMLGAANTAPTPTAITGDVTVTSAGVTAISAGVIVAADIASNAVETAKILDANVTAAKLAADSVETAKIKDANVTAAKLASNAVETAKILDANVTTAKIADANITFAKLATTASKHIARQGGSATNWQTVGTTNYTLTAAKSESGSIAVTGGATSISVTFPVAFSQIPHVFISPGQREAIPYVSEVTASGFTISVGTLAYGYGIAWFAVGE